MALSPPRAAREEIDGETLDDATRIHRLDAFLRGLAGTNNPDLCPPDKVKTNRCWRLFLDDIPGLEGEPYTFTENLPAYESYVPDLQRSDVDARTRGLSHVCLVLFNLNEFAYLD